MSSKGRELRELNGILLEPIAHASVEWLVKPFEEPVSCAYLGKHVGRAGPKHETREALLVAFGWEL